MVQRIAVRRFVSNSVPKIPGWVLHKPNGGVGDSRNAGLAMATGELLAFVDNDDRMEPTNLAELVDLLERCQADIAIGNFYEFGEADQTFYFRVREEDYYEKVYTPAEWFAEEYNMHFNLSQCFTVPWGKVYKRELFDQIAYPNDRAVEDDLTTWQFICWRTGLPLWIRH